MMDFSPNQIKDEEKRTLNYGSTLLMPTNISYEYNHDQSLSYLCWRPGAKLLDAPFFPKNLSICKKSVKNAKIPRFQHRFQLI